MDTVTLVTGSGEEDVLTLNQNIGEDSFSCEMIIFPYLDTNISIMLGAGYRRITMINVRDERRKPKRIEAK